MEPPAMNCDSYTHVLYMACHVYVYDACAAVSERVSHVGAQCVVHTSCVYDARHACTCIVWCVRVYASVCMRVCVCVCLCTGARAVGR